MPWSRSRLAENKDSSPRHARHARHANDLTNSTCQPTVQFVRITWREGQLSRRLARRTPDRGKVGDPATPSASEGCLPQLCRRHRLECFSNFAFGRFFFLAQNFFSLLL
ncbi:Cytidylate kinase [Frankliniella fusca]|uniref:Cytidylate kinase n=1 Tax=Frankliniella fusca TaxID=407009 RepID=A0AAE1HQQ3_9NEOP|nr:Cytidylate kinase [Frankliniella fusca]